MHWLDQGAYTGETSPLMLKALGVTHVLIGHSERRQYFNETDESVNLKLKSALAHGLIPIVCVGELLAEREANQTAEVLERQTSIALSGIDPAAAARWSSPTSPSGPSAPAAPQPRDRRRGAQDHPRPDRQIALPCARRQSTRILYGGSVKPDNTASLCCLPRHRRRTGRRRQPRPGVVRQNRRQLRSLISHRFTIEERPCRVQPSAWAFLYSLQKFAIRYRR
jgi:triosephosphate isomerase